MKEDSIDGLDPQVLDNYQIINKIGQGAYGQVWKVRHKLTSIVCVIKKIYDAFRNPIDAQRVYREIRYLQKIHHSNIIRILSYMVPEKSKDVYITLEFMQADLSSAIRNGVLRQIHKHFIFYQIANGVHYLHSGQLLHRDLKPSNILVNQNCQVKICDFGLVRSVAPDLANKQGLLTENIATRWYRAPEILLCSNTYGKEVDIWSLGCVLAQIFLGRPLFQGSSAISQLQKIFEVLGKPTREELYFVRSEASKSIVESLSVVKKRNFVQMFGRQDKMLIDLLEKIFKIDPKARITIEDIMIHPFVCKFKGRVEEIYNFEPIKIMNDSKRLSVEDYRQFLLSDIEETHYQDLKTGKQSEHSTNIQYSITQSLPTNQRSAFFDNKCPLGRPDRFSPQKPTKSKLLDFKYIFLSPRQKILQKQRVMKVSPKKQSPAKVNCNEVKNNTFIKKQKQTETNLKQKNHLLEVNPIITTTKQVEDKHLHLKSVGAGFQKVWLPFKIADAKNKLIPSNNYRKSHEQGVNVSRSPQYLMKAMRQMLSVYQKNQKNSRKHSPNSHQVFDKVIKQQQKEVSHAKIDESHKIDNNPIKIEVNNGVNKYFRRENAVPKFILQGRKKFRSGSPGADHLKSDANKPDPWKEQYIQTLNEQKLIMETPSLKCLPSKQKRLSPQHRTSCKLLRLPSAYLGP